MRISDWSSDVCSSDLFWILPGFAGGSPLGRASTCSMPSITSPHTVYWRSRNVASSKQMKNWLFALFGLAERAIEQTPRTWGSLLTSAGRLGRSDPLMPVPVGSPPCALKPGIKRRSAEHTSELQSLMRNSYAVFCLKKKRLDNDDTEL